MKFLVLVVVAAALSTVTAMKLSPSATRLTPAMEAALRAAIEGHLEKHPEMRFNRTRLRQIEEANANRDGTNDDTVSGSSYLI